MSALGQTRTHAPQHRYSITSSAHSRKVSGIVKTIVLAALILKPAALSFVL
jgi:hypothetical protein